MSKPTLIAVLGLALAASRARAEDPWLVTAEAGVSAIHDDDRSAGGALRLSRDLGSSPLRLQLGVAAATYGAVDLGVEWRMLPGARVSPFLGVGGGVMGEDDYGGTFVRVSGGLEARLSKNAVLRLGLQGGRHDGQAGPHQATLGVGWRF
jgi:hypothetical protein